MHQNWRLSARSYNSGGSLGTAVFSRPLRISCAVDANDAGAIDRALDVLNAHKGDVEQLEEDSGSLVESATRCSGSTLVHEFKRTCSVRSRKPSGPIVVPSVVCVFTVSGLTGVATSSRFQCQKLLLRHRALAPVRVADKKGHHERNHNQAGDQQQRVAVGHDGGL